MTSEEADAAKGKISTTSPIGRALLGKEVGDEVKVQSPGGAQGTGNPETDDDSRRSRLSYDVHPADRDHFGCDHRPDRALAGAVENSPECADVHRAVDQHLGGVAVCRRASCSPPGWWWSGRRSSTWWTAAWRAPPTRSRASAASSIRCWTATRDLALFMGLLVYYAVDQPLSSISC